MNRFLITASIIAALVGVGFTCYAFYVAGTNDGYDEGYVDAGRVTFRCGSETVQIDNAGSDVYDRFQECTLVPSK